MVNRLYNLIKEDLMAVLHKSDSTYEVWGTPT